MNTKELIEQLDYLYNSFIRLHKINFNKYIDHGDNKHRENMLHNEGAAFAILRIKEIIEAHNENILLKASR